MSQPTGRPMQTAVSCWRQPVSGKAPFDWIQEPIAASSEICRTPRARPPACAASRSVVVVPRAVLHFRRNPDGFIDLLEFLLLGDFVAFRHLRILGLRRTGMVAGIQAGRRQYL